MLGDFLRLSLERAIAIGLTQFIGQEIAIFGIGDEQKPEEHGQRHAVGQIEIGGRRIFEASRLDHGAGDTGHDAFIDAFAQAGRQIGARSASSPPRAR